MVVGPNATLVPQSLVAKIQNNEFIELGELMGDSLAYQDKASSSSCEVYEQTAKRNAIYSNGLSASLILNQPERTPEASQSILLVFWEAHLHCLVANSAPKNDACGWAFYLGHLEGDS